MTQERVVAAIKEWKARSVINSLYRNYYDGVHGMEFASEAFRKHYLWVLRNSRENLCEAVVDAFTGPIKVASWQGGGGKAATELSRTLRMSKIMNLAHDESWITGDGYVLVWPDRKGKPYPFVQSSNDMVVSCYPGTNEVEWAAKLWRFKGVGEGGKPVWRARVNIYDEKACERYYAPGFFVAGESDQLSADDVAKLWPEQEGTWIPFENIDGEPWFIPHQYDHCPVHWFPHNQRAIGKHGRSILHNVIPLQDGLNHSLATLIVGAEAFAQPLRLLLNIVEESDQVITIDNTTGQLTTGQPQKLKIDPTKESIVGVPGDHVSAHQFDPPDATKLVAVQDAFALKISRVVGLPTFDLTQTSGDIPSGAALRILRERKSSSIEDFEQDSQGTWEAVMADLGAGECEVEWAEVTPLDPLEAAQIAVHKKNIGYPFEELLIDFGESPDDIKRILEAKERADAAAQAQFEQRARGGLQFLQGNDDEEDDEDDQQTRPRPGS